QSINSVILDQVKSIATALITVLFGLLVIYPFIPTKEKGETIEIPPQGITKEFEVLLNSATRWRYKGNFGRYLRSKVLPTLASRPNIHVTACLIDPANQDLCEKHAAYRGSINAIDKGKNYDAKSVSLEVTITIVIASWYAKNRGMDIDIFLSGSFDPIRIDANDEAMILTVEDRRSPALMITKKHFTASHFDLQMQTAREQSRKIELDGMRVGIQLPEIEALDVTSVLEKAKLGAVCKELTPEAIAEACKKSRNPYEN
ncbi:MAG: hypothetical protein JO142_14990, partial [Burkholderiales bacterium]|nr:hypothetical protein [Burkholderiales bacterium]